MSQSLSIATLSCEEDSMVWAIDRKVLSSVCEGIIDFNPRKEGVMRPVQYT